MSKVVEYTNQDKVEVLDAIKRVGNITKVAEQFNISRGTIYNWKSQEDEIRKAVAKDEVVTDLRERSEIRQDVLKYIESYTELLQAKGTTEERMRLLGAKVEYLLANVVDMLENNPDLRDMHPKDQAGLIETLLNVKKQLYQEPDFIIEFKQDLMVRVIDVLKGEFLTEEQLHTFVDKMESIEDAEYEEL